MGSPSRQRRLSRAGSARYNAATCRAARTRRASAAVRRTPTGRFAAAREAPAAMKDIDDAKQPLLDHLIELRRRLLWCLATLIIAFFICFHFAHEILAVLAQPLGRAGQGKLIYTDVFEAFFTQGNVGLFAALLGCLP